LKKYIVLGVIFFSVCLLIGFYFLSNNSKEDTDDVIMKIAIYPTSVLDETYLFVLKRSEIIEVSLGVRKYQTIDSDFFMKEVIDTKKKKLTFEESEALLDVLDRIAEKRDTSKKKIVMDGWDVSIYYKEKMIDLNYTGNEYVFRYIN